ncbi:MAG: SIMPL domain-containing protein [Candidatus Paceibacterota bacterium]
MNIPKNLWSTAVAATALLVVFLAAISIKTFKEIGYVGANPNMGNSISVTGSGDAVAVPDVATFSFTISETAKTVADAQTAATTKINATLKAVRDAGVADKDIQTQSYNINPHYEYQNSICPAASYGMTVYCPSGKSIITGYDVSQSIQVKVRDLAKAGAIFTSIGSLAVENVNGLNFSVDDPDAVQAEARSKAITDAQNKAKILAKELGVRLVRITSFSENNGYYDRKTYGMGGSPMMAEVSAPAPQIPIGETKITNTVTISYEIK